MSRCERWSKRLETNHRRGAMGMPVGSVVWSATGLIAGRGLAFGAGGGVVGAAAEGAAVFGAAGVEASGVVVAAGGWVVGAVPSAPGTVGRLRRWANCGVTPTSNGSSS